MKKYLLFSSLIALLLHAREAAAQTFTVTVNRGDSPIVAGRPGDGWLRTNGTLLTAINLGSLTNQNRGPGNAIPFTGNSDINPSGTNWSAFGSAIDNNLGGTGAAIDPVFFTELWGNNPVTLTYSNLNPARLYVVQILHGEPRNQYAGMFTNAQFTTKVAGGAAGPTVPVPTFQVGNNIGSENPPNSNDLAIVTAQLTGYTSLTYVMYSASNFTRGPSFAGFQVRDISPPLVTTLAATSITTTSAVLNATVDPNSTAAKAYFQYGTTASYGSFTPTNNLPATNVALAVSNPLTNLLPNTTYHFRVVGSSSFGTNFGTDLTFATPPIVHWVTTLADSGPGSLRQAVLDSLSGHAIYFDPSLNGGSIQLTNGQLVLTNNLTIDASALPGGIQINPSQTSRIFQINNGAIVTLTALSMVNGAAETGGGILNDGNLTLNQCTLKNCNATNNTEGGAIYNNSGKSLTLNSSTIANCTALRGGGIASLGTATLNNCTITACTAYFGGGLRNLSTMRLNQCTVASNATFFPSSYDTGGIQTSPSGTLLLTNTIVAGNIPANIPQGPFTASNSLTNGDPVLAPLGNYGGRTATMPPMPGSPAIDAGADAITNSLAFDQRGSPRLAGAHVDIGAIELQTPAMIVTTSADSGPGSLRQIVDQADLGTSITFAPGLSGQTILLTSGQISLNKPLGISAAALPAGITINGNGASRIFEVGTNAVVVLSSLTLTNGYDANPTGLLNGAPGGGGGGAIRNGGTLTMNQCNVAGNRAVFAGGLRNEGSLTFNQGTLQRNAALGSHGGGINNAGTLFINQSTISGNTATNNGGGIRNAGAGTFTLAQCTLSSNTASAGGGLSHQSSANVALVNCTLSANQATNLPGGSFPTAGGGIIALAAGAISLVNCTIASNAVAASSSFGGGGLYLQSPAQVVLQNTIVAGNSSSIGPDIYFAGGLVTRSNANLIGNNSTVGAVFSAGFPNANSDWVGTAASPIAGLLAPLGNYGGATETMPPLSGSPAIDNGSDAVTNTITVDQRGVARLTGFHVDIGAAEYNGPASGPAVETQPATLLRLTVASLNAIVTPNSAVTTCHFEYGLTTNYGNLSAPIVLSSGITPVSYLLTNLSAVTTYHYRAIASNSFGTAVGADRTFFTVSYNPAIVQEADANGSVDHSIRTNGLQVAAANFGSESNVVRNGVTFPAAGTSGNPAGANWAATGSTTDPNLGGYANIDPLFFSELWGGEPITVTCSNLNPARIYLVQVLHGEPRACCAGSFSNNGFSTSANPWIPVPAFSFGNGIAGENPPNNFDRAIVEVELTGITSFTYEMYGGVGRGPSIAGFQVRDLQPAIPGSSPAQLTGLTLQPNGNFQFGFTNQPGASFTVFTTTNVAQPANEWLNLGAVPEMPPGSGQFQFTDTQATNYPQRYYRVSSP